MTDFPLSRIDEGRYVSVHGMEQWISIRGDDARNPVLLVIPGPGAGFCRMGSFFARWEKDFTLVQWDQPGAGVTHARNESAAVEPFTFERIARDGLVIADFVRQRLGVAKISLLAISAGTMVGLRMIRQHPEYFAAYVGCGQLVDWATQDALSYQLLLAKARAAEDQKAIADLEKIGAPPYADTATDAIKAAYAGALTELEQRIVSQTEPAVLMATRTPRPDALYVPHDVTLGDTRLAAMAAYDRLRNEIVAFDARSLGMEFAVPMLFLQGELDLFSVTSAVEAYAAEIRAPYKKFVSIQGAGHSPYLMVEAFGELLRANVHRSVA